MKAISSNIWLKNQIAEIYQNSIKENEEYKKFSIASLKIEHELIEKIKEYIKENEKLEEILELIDKYDTYTGCEEGITEEIIFKKALILGVKLNE